MLCIPLDDPNLTAPHYWYFLLKVVDLFDTVTPRDSHSHLPASLISGFLRFEEKVQTDHVSSHVPPRTNVGGELDVG